MYLARLLVFMVMMLPVWAWAGGASAGRPTVKIALLRTGQIGCYDENGATVEFLGSGQDCEQQRGIVWPLPRFVVNDDGTVLDKLTGLVWLRNARCFDGLGWLGAKKKIDELNDHLPGICKGYNGKYEDWRIPDVGQLTTLLNADAVPADYLRTQGFEGMRVGAYWTSTMYQNLLTGWSVNLGDGTISIRDKLEKLLLLPVRTPGRSDGQIETTAKHEVPTAAGKPARFTRPGDGTVLDTQTGLMWLSDFSCLPQSNWIDALTAVHEFNKSSKNSKCLVYKGTYHDWQLPNRLELLSLVDFNRDYPAVFPGAFGSDTVGGDYWSSTTVPAATKDAYVTNLDNGQQVLAAKNKKNKVLLVRRFDSSPLAPRLESSRASDNSNINPAFLLGLAPELHTDIVWPPKPRFLDNGDGTSMDRLTGITWLKDGNCFGRKSWHDAGKVIGKFNSDPRDFHCKGYVVTFGDWEIPTIDDMQKLLNPLTDDSAMWLNTQGVTNVQSGGDYWSKSESLLNLYYAKVLRFKGDGRIMLYPKSLDFFVWPHRILPPGENKKPLVSLTVNAINDDLELTPDYPISLVTFIHTFGLTFPADFWLWYDTPDKKQLWLSNIRSWSDEMKPVYQGALFNMRNYEIFRSPASGLAPGEYTFHFAVDAHPDGVLDKERFEAKVKVTIVAAKPKGVTNQQ